MEINDKKQTCHTGKGGLQMWNNSKEEKEESFNTFTAKAKLIAKNTFIYSEDRSLHSVYIHQKNLLTFKLENASRLVLEVSPSLYAYYLINDVGILTYKASVRSAIFIDFQLQTSPPQSPPLG